MPSKNALSSSLGTCSLPKHPAHPSLIKAFSESEDPVLASDPAAAPDEAIPVDAVYDEAVLVDAVPVEPPVAPLAEVALPEAALVPAAALSFDSSSASPALLAPAPFKSKLMSMSISFFSASVASYIEFEG